MTITGFTVSVPYPESAAAWFRRLAGDRAADLLHFQQAGSDGAIPTVIDTGCSHFCLRVTDIRIASNYLRDEGVDVLGHPMLIDSGPLENFYWQYFRSPWGGYFEIQQWALGTPSKQVGQLATHSELDPTASIPTVVGLDHAGFVVADLEAAVTALESIGGQHVLGSVADADLEFMSEQFNLATSDTLRMAMVRVGDINLELFQHDVRVNYGPPQRRTPAQQGTPWHTSLDLSTASFPAAAETLKLLGITVVADQAARARAGR